MDLTAVSTIKQSLFIRSCQFVEIGSEFSPVCGTSPVSESYVHVYDSVHNIYRAITLCDTSITLGSRCGKGGVAIIYNKTHL